MYNIPDNPKTRYELYLLHKELVVFIFSDSGDTISKLEKTGWFFQVSINFHPLHSWMQITKNSFSALQLLFATKLHHYFLVLSDTDVF